MALLVRPTRADDEGPCGYRSRLALANALHYKDLLDLDAVGEIDGFFINRSAWRSRQRALWPMGPKVFSVLPALRRGSWNMANRVGGRFRGRMPGLWNVARVC